MKSFRWFFFFFFLPRFSSYDRLLNLKIIFTKVLKERVREKDTERVKLKQREIEWNGRIEREIKKNWESKREKKNQKKNDQRIFQGQKHSILWRLRYKLVSMKLSNIFSNANFFQRFLSSVIDSFLLIHEKMKHFQLIFLFNFMYGVCYIWFLFAVNLNLNLH